MVDGDFGQKIREARVANLPVPWMSMSSRAKLLGAFLYAALVTLMIGSLLEVVAAVPDSNGWEAYRRVCSEVTLEQRHRSYRSLKTRWSRSLARPETSMRSGCLGKDV